jgi:hypothetical protein
MEATTQDQNHKPSCRILSSPPLLYCSAGPTTPSRLGPGPLAESMEVAQGTPAPGSMLLPGMDPSRAVRGPLGGVAAESQPWGQQPQRKSRYADTALSPDVHLSSSNNMHPDKERQQQHQHEDPAASSTSTSTLAASAIMQLPLSGMAQRTQVDLQTHVVLELESLELTSHILKDTTINQMVIMHAFLEVPDLEVSTCIYTYIYGL